MLSRMMLLYLLDLTLQEVFIDLLSGAPRHSILSMLGLLNQLRGHLIV
jgi:hypothetical protein